MERKTSITRFDLYLKRVGNNIKNIRLKSELTQLQVVEKTGIELRYYQRMESGRINMTLMTLYKLAKFFNVEMYELSNGVSKKKQSLITRTRD
ncbi:XRE family transcriptional regulator [bacterium]|jgi:transcriptional regulator with XRE-family HTH domain|nr:XRE family transcriptional regulator [bacterium]